MKLRVIVNTHKRPAQALAVIECLRALSSGKHEVSYVLAYDEMDMATDNFLYPDYIEEDCRPRPASVQDCWNRNLVGDYDFFLPMPDDGFCAAPDWDDLIVQTAAAAPVPELAVMGWLDQANPTMFTVPIVSRGWLEAIAPEPLLDPRFPFWFSDTAISETWSYVFSRTPPRPGYLLLAGKPGRPNPVLLREGGDKWWDLYAATRSERVTLAAQIRRAHSLRPVEVSGWIAAWERRDAVGREETQELVEYMKGAPQ